MEKKKIIIIGGQYLEVQELMDYLLVSKLPIGKIQIVGENDRIGQIHDFGNEPALVISSDHMAEEGYDLAIMLSPLENMEKVTADLVFGSIPFIDMAGVFEPSADVPVLLPESKDFTLTELPLISVLPRGLMHVLSSLVSAVSRECVVEKVTAFANQGVSATGTREAMDELFDQTRSILRFDEVIPEALTHQIAFNTFHIDKKDINLDVMNSCLRTVSDNTDLNACFDTAWSGHFVGLIGTLWLELKENIELHLIEKTLSSEAGIEIVDDIGGALGVVGRDEILVSDLKQHTNDSRYLTLRFGIDNLRRGMATSFITLMQLLWSVEK